MHTALALLAVLPALIAAPAPVAGLSTEIHVARTKQDFRGCLLFAGSCPALPKRQHMLKDIKHNTVLRSKNIICQLNPNILKRIPFPFMFGKDRDDKRNSLELVTSKSSDEENLADQAIESDCDWEYRDCDTRVITCITI